MEKVQENIPDGTDGNPSPDAEPTDGERIQTSLYWYRETLETVDAMAKADRRTRSSMVDRLIATHPDVVVFRGAA